MQQLAFPQASENVETPSEIVAQRWRRGTSNLDDFSYVILGIMLVNFSCDMTLLMWFYVKTNCLLHSFTAMCAIRD
uniref:Uncharacterized protein n=1 Tax=Triticum urartu TaxID=4572 RepID=A0A8R7UCZ2_TRIUA